MICTEGSYDPAKIWREVQEIDLQFESEKKDWNLEASDSEEAGQQAELRHQKAKRLAEAPREEEEYHERRYAEKMKGAV